MFIERIQIEEGFLDGLDVSFAHGLNVVIGERGTGKTSLVELIRFCLGVQSFTSESARRSLDHAVSILGSGQVTITLSDGEHITLVSRTAADDAPRASAPYQRPIVFSQTEIETVGLQEQGRINLLDSFTGDTSSIDTHEQEAASEVRSFTAQAETLRREIEELSRQLEEIPLIESQISELEPKEQELSKVSAEANHKTKRLESISSSIATAAVHEGAIDRFKQSASALRTSLSSLASASPSFEPRPEEAGDDKLATSREKIQVAKEHLNEAYKAINEAIEEADSQLRIALDKKLELENEARQLRKEVESLQAGAGAIVRQAQQLRERHAQLNSLKSVRIEREKILSAVLSSRNYALDKLDSVREHRFQGRNALALQMTEQLGPRIRVEVTRAGQFEAFSAAIADALRGSGLRYNELSQTLASNVSPRELLEAADANDYELIVESTGITKDRAIRVLAYLREADLGSLATASVEDKVSLQLLDGSDYKNINELSTGQRCTVVLPLVLRHTKRILVVDQPEDHIDNAFIADTLISSLLARSPASQIFFTTHNANIPVLGDADRVIQMGSDGKRGFPILASSLDDPAVVNAITTVMEGGQEAFERRAEFYKHHKS